MTEDTKTRLSKAAEDVLAERRRHLEEEGWTAEHDDAHSDGDLARAAAVYTMPPDWRVQGFVQAYWPWGEQWWKPSDLRRDLVKAGALILAEIERIDRKDKT